MPLIQSLMINHIRSHITIYTFMTVLFLTGIVFGAVIVNSMNFVQKQDLFFHLEQFFGQIATQNIMTHGEIFKQSLMYHIKFLLFLFILGISIIGLPIIWILIFLKGLVVGFTVGFIVNQLGINGLVLATLSVAPQNMIIVPIYIGASSLAMIFSVALLEKLFTKRVATSIMLPFSRYLTVYVLLIASTTIGALFEAFIAHEAMQSFIQSIH